MTELLDRIRGALVGLKMPRAMETLDHTVQRLEKGKITAIEAIDALPSNPQGRRRPAHGQAFAGQDTRELRL